MAEALADRYQFWNHRVRHCHCNLVRWMCHGHIGLAFIWAVYSGCVAEVCRRQGCAEREAVAEAQRVLQAAENVRFNACLEQWVQRALGNYCCYPVEVFRLLGVTCRDE